MTSLETPKAADAGLDRVDETTTLLSRKRDGARSLEPAEPHQRPIRMKNAIYRGWNRVADWTDAAIEIYDRCIDKPGRGNRFGKPDVILQLPKKADLQ